ncbi:triphosphoribosyl-dephospho-CoA synthase [Thermococcus sp.]|uniref:triphosphoribosyl-dephospho-CoA synthase n=1 Tax=Thermococcus sp. TaxID=35749 RepID=UPI002629C536|nr:triphosphoribosyl-dephospho-CoA synthase [Thermococcus sp.]
MERWRIIKAFTLGPLLEAAIPKPGNVNRYRDFDDLSFYNFLFAETWTVDILHEATKVGDLLRRGTYRLNEAGIGELIKRAVQNSKEVQDANPSFGVTALSIPLVIGLAAGRNMIEGREWAVRLIGESTARDTMELYRAIRLANPKGIPGGVKYDVYSDDSFREVFRDSVNLKRLAEISCDRELVFCEWINGYELSYRTFVRLYSMVKEDSLENAVRRAFLELLATVPDTLIIRKAGMEEAGLVMRKAKGVLNGEMSAEELDAFMREKGDLRNPGSLADVMAVALSLLLLRGYRFTQQP